jgi:Cu-Zn family superoxide dismutase
VGGHFDPLNTNVHACPINGTSQGNHLGDLGNWQATGGTINAVQTFKSFSISDSSNSVVGRSVVLHANVDDCMTIASSGSRLAVGVIGIQSVANGTNNAAGYSGGTATEAVCVLQGTSSCTGANCPFGTVGFVHFSQSVPGTITITAQVMGISTERGFHAHVFGDISSADGSLVGPHWNPDNHPHSLPGDANRHAGDFGSIKSFSQTNPQIGYYNNILTYSPASSFTIGHLIGHAIIVHELLDHGYEPSCPGAIDNGAAGKRVYQCVIGVAYVPVNQSDVNFQLPVIDTTGIVIDNNWVKVPCTSPPPPPAAGSSSQMLSIALLPYLFICSLLRFF